MSAIILLLIPFARLAGHSLASSLGFTGILLITVLPVHSVRELAKHEVLSGAHVQVFEWIETGLMALDVCLLVFVVVLYSGVFAVEQWRVVKKIIQGTP